MFEPAENSSFSPRHWLLIGLIFLAGIAALVLVARNNGTQNVPLNDPVITAKDDPVIARLNGQNITKSEFDLAAAYFALSQNPNAAPPNTAPMTEAEILDRLVQQKLLAGLASDLDLLEAPYTKNRLNFAREQILAEDSAAALLDGSVTDEDIAAYYDKERKIRSEQIQIKARQIVSPDLASAVEIVRRLDKGDAFASLALAFSIDRASRESGGDLGYLNPDMLDPVLSEKIFAGADGERIGPFETTQGWHVIEIMSRRRAALPGLEERRESIINLLRAQKLEARMTELIQNADLQIIEISED